MNRKSQTITALRVISVSCALLLIGGCDDSRDSGTRSTASAQIQVEPGQQIVFPAGVVGQQVTPEQVTIRNTGEGDLIVYDIKLDEDDPKKEFELLYTVPVDSEGNDLFVVDETHLCPQTSNFKLYGSKNEDDDHLTWCMVWVSMRVQDTKNDTGTLTIRSNDSQSREVVLDLTTGESNPELTVNPSRVEFNDVEEGRTETKKVTLFNSGKAKLTISRFVMINDAEGQFTAELATEASAGGNVFEIPAQLNPAVDVNNRDSVVILVHYTPSRVGTADAILAIDSDDPGSGRTEVPIAARSIKPCIEVVPREADFGDVAIGETKDLSLDITNCGNADLIITKAAFDAGATSAEYSIFSAPGGLDCAEDSRSCEGTLTVPQEQTVAMVLRYTPAGEGPDGGALLLSTNVPKKEELPIQLFGQGTTNSCPTAVAEARIAGSDMYDEFPDDARRLETIPLKTLELRGDRSTDQDGTIASYKWTVLERPDDSTAALFPHESAANPTFFLDLAGRYVFELQVIDNKGLPSCKNALIVAQAVPDEDIHIQLVWDTPADPDQTDQGFSAGSDVDLHFLHPLGDWFEQPHDCFYGNENPDWGRPASFIDDPSLDIDDTDGAGPENINLNNPENNRVYRVGVHYFNDFGYGASFVTVRIFIQGFLEYEYPNKRMAATDYFWDVATISWPNGTIQQIDNLQTTTPNGGGSN